MQLTKAIQDGWPPLAIRVFGSRRPVAELFLVPRGIVFADTGWSQLAHPGHPFHFVEGAQDDAQGPPWRVGEAVLEQIDHGDDLAGIWNEWVNFRASPFGRDADRARCEEVARRVEPQWFD